MAHVGFDDVFGAASFSDAADALQAALTAGLRPEHVTPRAVTDLTSGQMLVMPGEWQGTVGAKLVTVTPANPQRGLPRIQGLFVAFDATTLQTLATIDAEALTLLRTAGLSMLAARLLAQRAPETLVVFGTGPQAKAHINALGEAYTLRRVVVVGRDAVRAERLADDTAASADEVVAGRPDEVAAADICVSATTARTPLFDGALVRDTAVVVAIGSHEPDARELDSALLARSVVVVEDVATALREAGDVVLSAADGALRTDHLVPLTDLLADGVGRRSGPFVFKSVGMSWEDVVVARLVLDRVGAR